MANRRMDNPDDEISKRKRIMNQTLYKLEQEIFKFNNPEARFIPRNSTEWEAYWGPFDLTEVYNSAFNEYKPFK